jgi:hypothetical protein
VPAWSFVGKVYRNELFTAMGHCVTNATPSDQELFGSIRTTVSESYHKP